MAREIKEYCPTHGLVEFVPIPTDPEWFRCVGKGGKCKATKNKTELTKR